MEAWPRAVSSFLGICLSPGSFCQSPDAISHLDFRSPKLGAKYTFFFFRKQLVKFCGSREKLLQMASCGEKQSDPGQEEDD